MLNPLIIGSGMAGLLAGNMLLKKKPVIIDSQPSLPNNHSAVLRFRSAVVGDVLGIPFKKVKMIKTTLPWRNPVADALAYSFKNTGKHRSDRSVTAGLVQEERWIAPGGLIPLMAEPLKGRLLFNQPFKLHMVSSHGLVISTMPMPTLMNMLDYPIKAGLFDYSPGHSYRAKVADCDAYVSLVIPDPAIPFSRISITGDEVIAEGLGTKAISSTVFESYVHALLGVTLLGATEIKPMRYAKINPIDEQIRRDFMFWATDKHGIFSLGRFATWRPGLLLDDLVRDIRLIEGWAKDRYSMRRAR